MVRNWGEENKVIAGQMGVSGSGVKKKRKSEGRGAWESGNVGEEEA